MLNVLYILFIFPLEQLIELSYLFVFRIFNDPAISILGISLTVSILTLPLYFIAEKHQNLEREIQKKLKPEVNVIKSAFVGDERFMRLATYYRQNNYHPLYSLRSSISLFIQIPFFIAAFHFLSNLDIIKNIPFGIIQDLAKPDSLLRIHNNLVINILPIIMTIINCASAMIYTKGLSSRDKIQLYGMAAVFFVLLYNSPAGMVLYWTGNNIFSLVKNVLQKIKYPKLITFSIVSLFCYFVSVYLLFIHDGWIVKRVFLVLFLIFIPFLLSRLKYFFELENNIFIFKKEPGYLRNLMSILFIELCFLLSVYLLFVYKGSLTTRFSLAFFIILIPLIPYFVTVTNNKSKILLATINKKNDNTRYVVIYVLSLISLFLLSGLVIPSVLISSSIQQFSFIGEYGSPFHFLLNTILQSFSTFLLWPLCIFFLLSKIYQKKLAYISAIFVFIAITNGFLFPGNYGFLTLMFKFDLNPESNLINISINLLTNVIVAMFVLFFIKYFRKIMVALLTISTCAFILLGLININLINNEFNILQSFDGRQNAYYQERGRIFNNDVYRVSRNGKNVIVIMLDRAFSGLIPYIFEEKPHLYDDFNGFIWYNNTVSITRCSLMGISSVFGGYQYHPLEMLARYDTPILKKQNEATLLLPRIFHDNGFIVTVTDPVMANYVNDTSIFAEWPEIRAELIWGDGIYTKKWLDVNEIVTVNTADFIKRKFIRFSFFRFMPYIFRNYIYDNGRWLAPTLEGNNLLAPELFLDNYVALDILPEITEITETYSNSFNMIYNLLPHEPHILQVPEYIPSNIVTNQGYAPFGFLDRYHVNVASLLLLGKWFNFLKENDVYDNTRIIIVSDHGDPHAFYPNGFDLPSGERLEANMALLMVKDFNSTGVLSIDSSFMTNADVPLLAFKDLVNNPVNPWTDETLHYDKENGIIVTSAIVNDYRRDIYVWDIPSDHWLHVHTNIFEQTNWSQVFK